jgi:hypothetical protein
MNSSFDKLTHFLDQLESQNITYTIAQATGISIESLQKLRSRLGSLVGIVGQLRYPPVGIPVPSIDPSLQIDSPD